MFLDFWKQWGSVKSCLIHTNGRVYTIAYYNTLLNLQQNLTLLHCTRTKHLTSYLIRNWVTRLMFDDMTSTLMYKHQHLVVLHHTNSNINYKLPISKHLMQKLCWYPNFPHHKYTISDPIPMSIYYYLSCK